MRIGIIGFGHVGEAMYKIFPDSIIYDEPKKIGGRDQINECDVVFVCVPTPMRSDEACDTSIIDEVLSWLQAKNIIIRSTVPVGFTKEWQTKKRNSNLIFQPEYYGETNNHPLSDLRYRTWITLGGETGRFDAVIQAYQEVYTSNIFINLVDSNTAELAKYMENCFLATKVTFCNEFYDIAKELGVDYNQLRETWLLDPRIGRSHTFVYNDNRGFGGACLPKDLAAMIYQSDIENVDVTLLKAVQQKNNFLKKKD